MTFRIIIDQDKIAKDLERMRARSIKKSWRRELTKTLAPFLAETRAGSVGNSRVPRIRRGWQLKHKRKRTRAGDWRETVQVQPRNAEFAIKHNAIEYGAKRSGGTKTAGKKWLGQLWAARSNRYRKAVDAAYVAFLKRLG